MEQSKIQELLLQVNPAYDNSTGDRFNIFKTLRVGHNENIHSAIIAEFLNPKSTHDLKEKFLELFLDAIKSEIKIINEHFDFECKNASVKTEAYTGEYGRIDILIKNNKKQAIIIENKIDANDQNKQLIRYDNYAKTRYENNYIILYLTLDGKDASEQSSDDVKYIKISYKYNIINWLKKCSSISENHPLVQATIDQFINHVKQITGQDMDTTKQQEIANLLCDSPENVKKAFAVYKSKDAFIKTFAERYVKPSFEKVVTEINNKFPLLKLELKTYFMDPKNGYRIIFLIANSSICLRFELEPPEYNFFRYGLTEDTDAKIYEKKSLNCLPQNVNSYWHYGWDFLFYDKSWDSDAELENGIKEHAIIVFQEMEERRIQ